jgi:hypothetical protein
LKPIPVVAVLAGCAGMACGGDGGGGGGGAPSPASLVPFESLPTSGIRPAPLPDGKLAMVAYMLTGSDQTEATWRKALQQMRALGVQVVEIGQIAWHDIETQPGMYRWGYAETVLRINQEDKLGLEIVTDLMFVNPGLDSVPRLPAHLEGLAFDDPQVVESLSRLYEAYLALPGADATRYLFQHFENAAAVVADRPDDVPRLQQLLQKSFERAKAARPGLLTGVCVQQYRKPHWPASEVDRWNAAIGTDVVPVISFGPFHFEGEDATRTRQEFEAIRAAAGGRPVALHEAGHHSSEEAKSSYDKQSAFVLELFALLRDDHAAMAFSTWYEYSDLEPVVAKSLGEYLAKVAGDPSQARYFETQMGSTGLLTHDGLAKPAARAWAEQAATYYRGRGIP